MRNSSPSHLWPGCQTTVNMTKAKFNRDYWSGVKIAKNWARWCDQQFHPIRANTAKLGILLLHVLDQVHHPEDKTLLNKILLFQKITNQVPKQLNVILRQTLINQVLKKVKIPVGVAELVVIPGDKLHKSWRQLNSSFSVHNGWPGMTRCCL